VSEDPGITGTPATIAGRFTPPDGQTLLIVGQDLGAVAGYAGAVHPTPGGVTTYTGLWDLGGLESVADWGAGHVDAQATLDTYPQSALVIGLEMVEDAGDELNRLAEGAYDDQVDALGRFIRAAGRPVFLRIGYEFDGPWNHYDPAEYVAAWRHVVARLRSAGVDNFATVWQSAANVTFEDRPFPEWWPGDDSVDWIGTSLFFLDENLGRHAALIDWAAEKGKPVMICEAAPRGYNLDESPDGAAPFAYPDRGLTFSRDGVSFSPRTSEQIWSEWYAPLFELVRDNSHAIRALAYINVEWNAQEMWGAGSALYWGDSRVEANALIRERWLAETGTDSWLHGGPQLFDALERRPRSNRSTRTS
jgi:hypothetical protein